MILNIYTHFNNKAGFSTHPVAHQDDPEKLIAAYTRALKVDPHVLDNQKDHTIYLLGTYDDEKMSYDLLPSPISVLVVAQLILDTQEAA